MYQDCSVLLIPHSSSDSTQLQDFITKVCGFYLKCSLSLPPSLCIFLFTPPLHHHGVAAGEGNGDSCQYSGELENGLSSTFRELEPCSTT